MMCEKETCVGCNECDGKVAFMVYADTYVTTVFSKEETKIFDETFRIVPIKYVESNGRIALYL